MNQKSKIRRTVKTRSIHGALILFPYLLCAGVLNAQGTDEAPNGTAIDELSEPMERLQDDWLVGGFDSRSRWLTAGLALGLGAYLASADTSAIRDLGDVTQLIPGVFALTSNLIVGDREGLKQFGYAGVTTLVATHGLKEIVDKTRPDDSADNSFPSGHTSASVLGAAYVWRRYGAKWGAPTSLLAAYTGVSRIHGQKHFADDVISGAAIGLISNLLWTDPIDERVQLSLFPLAGGAGLHLRYDPSGSPTHQSDDAAEVLPSRYFRWEMGLADVTRNNVISPNPDGSMVDWRFDQENNPTVTAFVGGGWSPSPESRHNLYVGFSPFEVRESFNAPEDIDFAGESFAAGNTVRSRYVANDYRLGYGYSVLESKRFNLMLGASLAIFDTLLELATDNEMSIVDTTVVKPALGVTLEVSPADRWLFFASYNNAHDSEVLIEDFTAQLAFRIDASWALSLGYRRVDRKIEADELANDVHRSQIALGVWYLW